MNIYTRLGKNTLLIFFGVFGSKVISFLMLPLYILWLSAESYGTIDLINTYNLFLFQIASLAISEAIFVFPKNSKKQIQGQYYSTGLVYAIFTFVLTAIIFYFALEIMKIYDVTNTFTQYSWYIYLIMFVTFLHNYNQQFCRSINKIKVYAFSGLINAILIAFFSFLFIPKFGVNGYIWTNVLSFSLSSIYTFFFGSIATSFITSKIRYGLAKKLLLYSIPMIPNSIMWWLINALNRPIIEYYEGLKMVGAYAVSHKIPSLIYIVFSVFLYSWQITAFEEFHKKNYTELYNKILSILSIILIFISCIITVFSKEILLLISSEIYTDAWVLIPIISIGVVFASFSGFVGVNFSVLKQSKYYFYSSLWGGLVSIIFNFILIPSLGIIGAAVASTASHLVILIFRLKYSYAKIKITDQSKYFILVLINLVIIYLTLSFQNTILNLIITSILFIIFVVFNKKIRKDINLLCKNLILK